MHLVVSRAASMGIDLEHREGVDVKFKAYYVQKVRLKGTEQIKTYLHVLCCKGLNKILFIHSSK